MKILYCKPCNALINYLLILKTMKYKYLKNFLIYKYVTKTNITVLLDTAYVKCDGKWYECNDTVCTLLKSESQIVVS